METNGHNGDRESSVESGVSVDSNSTPAEEYASPEVLVTPEEPLTPEVEASGDGTEASSVAAMSAMFSNSNTDSDSPRVAPKKIFRGPKASKFKHIAGVLDHPSRQITNLKTVKNPTDAGRTLLANNKHIVVGQSGAGGRVIVLKHACGKQGDSGVPTIENGGQCFDIAIDPFFHEELRFACALENCVKLYVRDETELKKEPVVTLQTGEKNTLVSFSPVAADVLAVITASGKVQFWNVSGEGEMIREDTYETPIIYFAWTLRAQSYIVVLKGGSIHFRDGGETKQIDGLASAKSVRCALTSDSEFIVATVQISSQRSLKAISTTSGKVIAEMDLGSGPGLHELVFNHDVNLLYLSEKGSRQISAYEFTGEEFLSLSTATLGDPYQSVAFLPKSSCNVAEVEVAKAVMTSKGSAILPITFTVPRIRKEFFQDDIYPDSWDLEHPVITAAQWAAGEDVTANRASLCPADMGLLSEAPAVEKTPRKPQTAGAANPLDTANPSEEVTVMTEMRRLRANERELEQDSVEGVAADEWKEED